MSDLTIGKGKRVAFQPSARLEEMVDELRVKMGYSTKAEVYIQGVIEMHRKTFPPYSSKSESLSDEDKLKAKHRRREDEKRVKAELEEERLLAICDELNGTLIDTKSGKVCRYFTYDRKSRYEQEIPLSLLTDDLVDRQYSPDRETVERYQAEGKVKYDLNEQA